MHYNVESLEWDRFDPSGCGLCKPIRKSDFLRICKYIYGLTPYPHPTPSHTPLTPPLNYFCQINVVPANSLIL